MAGKRKSLIKNNGEVIKHEMSEPMVVDTGRGKSRLKNEPLSSDIYKRYTFYLEPRHNLALEEIRLKLKRDENDRDKSDLVREAIDDLIKKFSL